MEIIKYNSLRWTTYPKSNKSLGPLYLKVSRKTIYHKAYLSRKRAQQYLRKSLVQHRDLLSPGSHTQNETRQTNEVNHRANSGAYFTSFVNTFVVPAAHDEYAFCGGGGGGRDEGGYTPVKNNLAKWHLCNVY